MDSQRPQGGAKKKEKRPATAPTDVNCIGAITGFTERERPTVQWLDKLTAPRMLIQGTSAGQFFMIPMQIIRTTSRLYHSFTGKGDISPDGLRIDVTSADTQHSALNSRT